MNHLELRARLRFCDHFHKEPDLAGQNIMMARLRDSLSLVESKGREVDFVAEKDKRPSWGRKAGENYVLEEYPLSQTRRALQTGLGNRLPSPINAG